MKISPARIAAFEILAKIENEKAFSSVLLPIYEEKLEPKDRALTHEIVLGVLRKQILLDLIIEKLTEGKKIDSAVKIILRIAIYQLKFLDRIPAHAAINDAVNLTQKVKKTSAKGFVNAVLRRFTRETIEMNFRDEVEKITVETSHPIWLIEKWIKQFGLAETASLAKANNQTPELNFRFTTKTTEAVKQSLTDEKSKKDTKFLRDLAENGKIYFQDSASQMVAEVVSLKPSKSFLDVCCAPASKFSYVNYLTNPENNLFIGGDFYLQRLKTAEKTCRRLGVKNYNLLAYDAENCLPFAESSFEVILLDAPCSGTGTIRSNPEIRYFLKPEDFEKLSSKQLKILLNASKTLKSGGRLIYSTCSLETEENEAVIEKFLRENSKYKLEKVKLAEKFQTEKGFVRTFPHTDRMDGFFIAQLRKI